MSYNSVRLSDTYIMYSHQGTWQASSCSGNGVLPAGDITHLPLDKMAVTFADAIFRCIFVNEKFCILTKISTKFVPKGPINNNPALV